MAPADFSVKETRPNIGKGRVSAGINNQVTSSLDLVEETYFLFVRVVKARDLPWVNGRDIYESFVEIKIGNYKGTTKYAQNNLEWNEVFAFRKERIQAVAVDIFVRQKDLANDEIIGKVGINVSDIPTRVPPDSSLAPQWHKLQDKNGINLDIGDLMLAIWFGTQADEVFPYAWNSDLASVSGESIVNTRSRVYSSPRLWYLRINIIEGQDLVPKDKKRMPEVYVKATLGTVSLRSKVSPSKSLNPKWNEDLMFVTAEPFYDQLILSVEDKQRNNQEETLGRCVIPLSKMNRRWLPEPVGAKWYNLEQVVVKGSGQVKEEKFATKLNMRICLDSGYHVFDEPIHLSSDYRATQKTLWTATIGVLELGIIGASGLAPMKSRDGHETTDAYCVAKYGPKWARTRTAIDTVSPKWNEQYTWEVYEPYTVLTIGIFDNCHLQGEGMLADPKDPKIGKIRIRLSTLTTNRIYTHSYPIIALQPFGVKKMGELQLAIRFTCPSYTALCLSYKRPLFPKMHYTHPLSAYQLDSLRKQAIDVISLRLSRTEPPLRKEVVECMLDVDAQMWSMRKAKANFQRLMAAFNVFVVAWRWWKQMVKGNSRSDQVVNCITWLALMAIIICRWYGYMLAMLFVCCYLVGFWQYLKRPRNPPYMDIKLSLAESANADELDEEFDSFPSSKQGDVLRMRYDRLRSIAAKAMIMVGDLASQGERLHSLISWEDPSATAIFLCFSVLFTAFCYFFWIDPRFPPNFIPSVVVSFLLRPPILRVDIPARVENFFRRLPTKADRLL